MEIVVLTLKFVMELLSTAWGLLSGVAVYMISCAHWLHLEAPRLEGLLVGVLFTWLLVRRDRHPLLKVLSAPLKLILDILDLVWDQALEVLGDIKGTVVGWLQGSSGWVLGKMKKAWAGLLGGLASIRDRLLKRKS